MSTPSDSEMAIFANELQTSETICHGNHRRSPHPCIASLMRTHVDVRRDGTTKIT